MLGILQKLRILLPRQDKIQFVWVMLLTAIAALWEVLGIGLMIPVVAAVVNPDLLEQNVYLKIFYNFSPFKEHRAFMIFTALLVVLNFALKNLFNYLVVGMQAKLIFRKQYELSERLFGCLMKSKYRYLTKYSPAELSARLNRVGVICEGTLLPVVLIISDFMAVFALLLAVVFFMPLYLTGALAALIVLALMVYLPFRRANGRISVNYVNADNSVSAVKIEAFSGIKAIRSSNAEEFYCRKFNADYRKFADVSSLIYRFGQLPRFALEFLAVAMAMGIFVAMIACNVPSGTVVLCFALLVAAVGRILPALSRIHYNLTRVRQVSAAFNGLYEDLTGADSELSADSESVEKLHLQCELEIKNLTFSHQQDKPVFDNFSLKVPAFSSLAVVGPTGGGKTTLADLIVGLYQPDSGRICFDGVDVTEKAHARREIIGYVPQYVFAVNGSIRENVALGIDPQEIDDNKVMKVLQMAHLRDWVESLPDKLDAQIGDSGVNLSGGQRQRLGIARALYREPELLILDEATSALDEASENAVVEALETLHGKLTMLVIAHRLSTIEHCEAKITVGK